MRIHTWDDIKDLIGEDLALFTVFMSTLEASEILEGFVKMAKGAHYISEDTMDLMYKEMASGIARETIENHIKDRETLELLDDHVFWKGIDDLADWMEMADEKETSSYFSYLSRWDLEGHDWLMDRPEGFGEYLRIIPD